MQADNIHSTIERTMKRVINIASAYIDVCKNARKNPRAYDIMFLDHTFSKRFNNVQFLQSIRPGCNKDDTKITDIRAFEIIPKQRNKF